MGNVSEWSGDLYPISRGPKGDDLPWFCLAALSEEAFSATNPPVCPQTARCVYGQYRPYVGADYGIYPVCITSDTGRFSGTRGALFGGSYRDETLTRDVLGTFGRRVESEPEDCRIRSGRESTGFGAWDSGRRHPQAASRRSSTI